MLALKCHSCGKLNEYTACRCSGCNTTIYGLDYELTLNDGKEVKEEEIHRTGSR